MYTTPYFTLGRVERHAQTYVQLRIKVYEYMYIYVYAKRSKPHEYVHAQRHTSIHASVRFLSHMCLRNYTEPYLRAYIQMGASKKCQGHLNGPKTTGSPIHGFQKQDPEALETAKWSLEPAVPHEASAKCCMRRCGSIPGLEAGSLEGPSMGLYLKRAAGLREGRSPQQGYWGLYEHFWAPGGAGGDNENTATQAPGRGSHPRVKSFAASPLSTALETRRSRRRPKERCHLAAVPDFMCPRRCK